MEKDQSYETLSKTTHFPSVFCEVGVVQWCTEAQEGIVQDELMWSVSGSCPLVCRFINRYLKKAMFRNDCLDDYAK